MNNYTFTELQIINIWLSSIIECTNINNYKTFTDIKEHLGKHGIRLETGIHMNLQGKEFYIDQTNQVQEQIPQIKTLLTSLMNELGYLSPEV